VFKRLKYRLRVAKWELIKKSEIQSSKSTMFDYIYDLSYGKA